MFGRVWLVSYVDSFLEPQIRELGVRCIPTTPGEELNKRCCPLPDTPLHLKVTF